jgi:hypothetical protein
MELIQIPSSGSSIDKYSQPILADSKLTKTEIIIYDASTKQKIMYLSDEEKMRIANTIITMVKVRLSLKDRAKHEDAVESQMIFSDLNRFDFLTEAEILLALENGLDGSYLKEHESNVFWNPSNFVLWIKRYLLEKNDVMRKVTNAKPADYIRHTPKDEEIKQQGILCANDYADLYARTKDADRTFKYPAGLNFLYDLGEQYGWLHLDEEVKNQIKMAVAPKFLHLVSNPADVFEHTEFNWAYKVEFYKRFIKDLVTFEVRIDQQGKIKPIA